MGPPKVPAELVAFDLIPAPLSFKGTVEPIASLAVKGAKEVSRVKTELRTNSNSIPMELIASRLGDDVHNGGRRSVRISAL